MGSTPRRQAARIRDFGTTIFSEITANAQRFGAVNLGQGFPDFDGPEFVRAAAREAIADGHNQYARGSGTPELVEAISAHERTQFGASYDPVGEVTVTAGATEAIHSAVLALCDPGDEVLLFEPFYDAYLAAVRLAGGIPRLVRTRAQDFGLDVGALEAAVSAKSRLLILNSPNNPTGRVFRPEELDALARVCVEHDLVAITDEVYEHLVYDGAHVPLATRSGMRERTIKISSAGKTFGLTGWKVGWACAPPDLTEALRAVHQFVTFAVATPLQHAVAIGLRDGADYFESAREAYRAKRDRLCRGLEAAGFSVRVPEGGYFVVADGTALGFADGVECARQLPERLGVAAVPLGAFFDEPAAAGPLVRFAFCKTDEAIDEAIRRLRDRGRG